MRRIDEARLGVNRKSRELPPPRRLRRSLRRSHARSRCHSSHCRRLLRRLIDVIFWRKRPWRLLIVDARPKGVKNWSYYCYNPFYYQNISEKRLTSAARLESRFRRLWPPLDEPPVPPALSPEAVSCLLPLVRLPRVVAAVVGVSIESSSTRLSSSANRSLTRGGTPAEWMTC